MGALPVYAAIGRTGVLVITADGLVDAPTRVALVGRACVLVVTDHGAVDALAVDTHVFGASVAIVAVQRLAPGTCTRVGVLGVEAQRVALRCVSSARVVPPVSDVRAGPAHVGVRQPPVRLVHVCGRHVSHGVVRADLHHIRARVPVRGALRDRVGVVDRVGVRARVVRRGVTIVRRGPWIAHRVRDPPGLTHAVGHDVEVIPRAERVELRWVRDAAGDRTEREQRLGCQRKANGRRRAEAGGLGVGHGGLTSVCESRCSRRLPLRRAGRRR